MLFRSGPSTRTGNSTFSNVVTFTSNVVYGTTSSISANGTYGTPGQALVSNGTGIYWGTVVAGSNTQVQYNNSGQPAGSAGLTFNNTTNSLSISNTVSVGGQLIVANATTISNNATISGIVNITGGGGGQALSLYSGGDMWFYSAGNTNSAQIYCDNANEMRTNGNSWVNGSLLAVGDVISNYSDDRLKDKVGSISNALDKVKALDGFYYVPNRTALDLGIEKNQLSTLKINKLDISKYRKANMPE